MAKKAVERLFDGVDDNRPGRHLASRVDPKTLKAIASDMDDIVELAQAGSARPPFARIAEFIIDTHAVAISVNTAKSLYRKAEQRNKNGKA